MKRDIDKQLVSWKQSSSRKLLVLKGACKFGKTYILKYFCGKAPEYHIATAGSLNHPFCYRQNITKGNN